MLIAFIIISTLLKTVDLMISNLLWGRFVSKSNEKEDVSDKRGCVETEWERQDNTMGDSAALFVTQSRSRITSEQEEAAVTQQLPKYMNTMEDRCFNSQLSCSPCREKRHQNLKLKTNLDSVIFRICTCHQLTWAGAQFDPVP